MNFIKKWDDVIIVCFLFIGLTLAMFNGEWLSFIAIILFISYVQLTKIAYDLESLRDFQAGVIRALIGRVEKGENNNDEK